MWAREDFHGQVSASSHLQCAQPISMPPSQLGNTKTSVFQMKFWQHISYVCTEVDLDARCTGSGLFFPDCCKAFHKMQRIYQHFIEQYDCMHHCLLFPDKQMMMMMMMMMKGSGWENKETTLPQSSLVHTARNMSSTTSLLLHSPHWDLT